MTIFDESQKRVLELDTDRHARVLGAPGTGKTVLLIEAFAQIAIRPDWAEGSVLVLASNRLVASQLRHSIERRVNQAMAGTMVRTATSFAFAVLQRAAALRGDDPPRLLTGTAQDEQFERVLNEAADAEAQRHASLPFAAEVLRSEAFRGELRELNRVIDDFALDPEALARRLVAEQAEHRSSLIDEAMSFEQWLPAIELVAKARSRMREEHAGELTASSMMRGACELLQSDGRFEVPKLVLIDDAADVGEGALALLAALAQRGTKIWAFGDPDTATGAFHGERARLLASIGTELSRRGVAQQFVADEQLVVLDRVHRHGADIRAFVSGLAARVGAAGAGQQRRAEAAKSGGTQPATEAESSAAVQFALASTSGEQLGIVAHRLRSRHLGLGGSPRVPWSQMAVVCRSRAEVKRAARLLSGHQVPSSVTAGGLVLREHQLVREFVRLLQHALGLAPLGTREVAEVLCGNIGGIDPIAMRRLRSALRLAEVRAAQHEGRSSLSADELLFEAFQLPGDRAVLDMRAARQLRQFALFVAQAQATHDAGGTPREVLWQLWQGSGLADSLQRQALESKGTRSDEAHRALDAVVGLFFTLQRHEEQDSERPIADVLEALLTSTVAEDTLAARSEREVVTVTTPQGLVGREFEIVCILGLQDGEWPNLRSRGSLLGVAALERWLRDGSAISPTRRDTMHDELRLFVHSAARAKSEVLAIAVANEDQHPSPFFTLGRSHLVDRLPSARLTLRGAVAEMRRRAVQDSSDREAFDSLVALARAGVAGAHPDEWYGVLEPSTTAPLVDIEQGEKVRVSPSQLERAEQCPLDWIVNRLGASSSDYRADIGTLLHRALETAAPQATAQQLLDVVLEHWSSLRFEAPWQSSRALDDARHMVEALADYLRQFEQSGARLLATESSFELPIEFALLRGNADRIEALPGAHDGAGAQTANNGDAIAVVDLKSGRVPPSAQQVLQHAQLQAYQLGVIRGAFTDEHGEPISASSITAKLLYVHPDAINATRKARGEHYLELEQPALSQEAQQLFEDRVLEVARVMAGASFTAQVEHHCDAEFGPSKSCSLHIIPAVSHA